jgi:hypothetical protein
MRSTINPQQLRVLRRLGDNAAPLSKADSALALTIYALRSRGLGPTAVTDAEDDDAPAGTNACCRSPRSRVGLGVQNRQCWEDKGSRFSRTTRDTTCGTALRHQRSFATPRASDRDWRLCTRL